MILVNAKYVELRICSTIFKNGEIDKNQREKYKNPPLLMGDLDHNCN